jgi:hypothetical protein
MMQFQILPLLWHINWHCRTGETRYKNTDREKGNWNGILKRNSG